MNEGKNKVFHSPGKDQTLTGSLSSPSEVDLIGLGHVSIGGELVRLLKCRFCSFRNIYEDTITHHLRYKDDPKHDVNLHKLDKKIFIATKTTVVPSSGNKKELLLLPSIGCLWCNYTDKVKRDLEWHFLEQHKDRLYKMKVAPGERRRDRVWTSDEFSFMYSDLEYRIYKAIRLAKRKSGKQG